ncbi:hypothetical protein PLIP_a2778 [Pseudoalteromonas lipolytica LMEB 39]|nr:hypothetical protein [Pseudoalteromonas lipolytica LMEB 39]
MSKAHCLLINWLNFTMFDLVLEVKDLSLTWIKSPFEWLHK